MVSTLTARKLDGTSRPLKQAVPTPSLSTRSTPLALPHSMLST